MHLILAHAHAPSPEHLAALRTLELPHLHALLPYLHPMGHHSQTEDALTPLSERLAAQAQGLPTDDGLVPWAAVDAQTLGLPTPSGNVGWAWITPCSTQVHTHHVAMATPHDAAMTHDEAQTLRQAMQPYFEEDGIALHPGPGDHPGTWLACGAALHQLPTASLQRMWGQAIDTWIPRQPQAKSLRRLQNEMQMLLYTHPVNDARSARGQAPINSFWISGTGTLPDHWTPDTTANNPVVHCTDLHPAAWDGSIATWKRIWQQWDQEHGVPALQRAREGAAVCLSLCADHHARTWSTASPGWTTTLIHRLRQRLQPNTVHSLISNL